MFDDLDTQQAPPQGATMDDIYRWAIARALLLENGNKPRAAERLGIALKTLYNRLTRWELTGAGRST